MSQARVHIPALTGIRGFAAVWVSLFHLQHIHPFYNPEIPFLTPFLMKGWLGVDLFFILSGFILSHVYASSITEFSWDKTRKFYRKRIARIYPAHLASLLLYLPVVFLAPLLIGYEPKAENFSPQSFFLSLFLLNGWGIPGSEGWNVPSWSVSSEWAAYLVFPFIAPFLLRYSKASLDLLLCVVLVGAMYVLSFNFGPGTAYFLDWSFVLLRIGTEFIIGMLIFKLQRGKELGLIYDRGALAIMLLLPLLATPLASSIWDGLLILLFAVFIYCLSLAKGPFARHLGSRFWVWMGKISYCFYLIHSLVIMMLNQLGKRLLPETVSGQLITLALFFLLTTLAAYLLYRFVEEPMRKRIAG